MRFYLFIAISLYQYYCQLVYHGYKIDIGNFYRKEYLIFVTIFSYSFRHFLLLYRDHWRHLSLYHLMGDPQRSHRHCHGSSHRKACRTSQV